MARKITGKGLLALLRRELRRMSAGDQLPTVRELMQRHRVSQSVVAQALSVLQQEGLIESQVGRGTFVTELGALRQVLWVCGIDLYHGEISPYYTHHLRLMREECARRGLALTALWLSNFRFDDALPYCTAEATDKFAGFCLVGCVDDHPLLRYLVYRQAPVARLSYDMASSPRIALPTRRTAEEILAHCRKRKLRSLAVMCDTYTTAVFRDLADEDEIVLEFLPIRIANRWMTEYHRFGYQSIAERIAAGPLPEGIYISDDMLAIGASRALLELLSDDQRRGLELMVKTTVQTMVPLGLPTAYLVADIEAEVRQTVEVLLDQIEGGGRPPDICEVACRMLSAEEAVTIWRNPVPAIATNPSSGL